MSERTLVIGGTGPTGPTIVQGLIDRGHTVSVLNRGLHEPPDMPTNIDRIVGDPHFAETLEDALGSRTFDNVVATYGRIRHVAKVMATRTGRLVTVGGSPGIKGSRQPELLFPRAQAVPVQESAARVESEAEFKFGYLARISEDAVLEHHQAGHYIGTHLRYPLIYGPRQLRPAEWQVMQRVLDGRRHIVLPDSGLTLISRGYALNMAHAVLLAVDQPESAGGEIFNCADVTQMTLAQWVEVITHAMNTELEVVSVPGPTAYPARDMMINRRTSDHQLFDVHKIRHRLGYSDIHDPVEALGRTVRWYMEHPPELTAEARETLQAHYVTEDAMRALVVAHGAQLDAVPFRDPDYRHPYAHPKTPGAGGDHHGR